MRRLILIASMLLMAARPAAAGTFERARIAPELGADALTRGVARTQVGRDLFASPYATATLGSVDVYDVFPYVESRTFQIVSDPRWNRLVYGEVGRSLKAFDGAGLALGALSGPRGLAVDENDRVYVADAGNNRVLVLQATTSQGDIALSPLFEIRGLSGPYDVAYSDGGTPFAIGDDALYVVDTGRNRVVAYALDAAGARQVATLGDLGSGPNRFAGPMAIAVGRSQGANTRDVFVADAHTQRIVHLRHDASGLRWVGEAHHDATVVTSLQTDQWGNLYAAAPNQGIVRKFSPDLEAVAELHDTMSRPRGFHVPFVNVRDHRAGGTLTRVGRPNGVSVDAWTDASGMRLWGLGVDVVGLGLVNTDSPAARFTLTDPAELSLDILEANGGRTLVHRTVGTMTAGLHTVSLSPSDLSALSGSGDLVLRLKAVSGYPDAPSAVAETGFRMDGATVGLPSQAVLLGNTPNPVHPYTRIAFVLPSGPSTGVTLRVYDAAGRTIRQWNDRFAPGRNEVLWDGTDDHGSRVAAGVYFYRLRTAAGQTASRDVTRKMVLVR